MFHSGLLNLRIFNGVLYADQTIGAMTLDVQMSNLHQSKISIHEGGIDIRALGELNIESTGNMNVLSGGKLNIKSDGNIEVEGGAEINVASTGKINIASGGSLNLTAGGNLNLSGGNFNLTGGSGTKAIGMSTNRGDEYMMWAGSATPSAAPFSVKMDGTITNVGNSYVQTAADNASNTNGVKMDVFFPDDVSAVDKCYLSVKFSAFRAYSTGAASGGGQTSSAGGAQTSSTVAATEKTSYGGSGSTGESSGATGESQPYTDYAGTGNTGSKSVTISGSTGYKSGAESHNHAVGTLAGGSHTHTGPEHRHQTDPHTHGLSAHTHTVGSHTHKITIDAHSHTIDNHTHTVDNHTHNITYGIYEGTTPTSCSVYVDGTLVPALSGVAAFTSHDIANYFSKTGGKITRNTFHTVEIRPNTALGRISAHLYIKTTQISKVAGVL